MQRVPLDTTTWKSRQCSRGLSPSRHRLGKGGAPGCWWVESGALSDALWDALFTQEKPHSQGSSCVVSPALSGRSPIFMEISCLTSDQESHCLGRVVAVTVHRGALLGMYRCHQLLAWTAVQSDPAGGGDVVRSRWGRGHVGRTQRS